MKALILNSGRGSRMGDLTNSQPKCMTALSDKETILSRQLNMLIDEGITDIVITTGYQAEVLKAYVKELNPSARISFAHNDRFGDTNYIYSMFLAKDELDDDIILMHGDLVFERQVLKDVVESKDSCMVVSSTAPLPKKDFKAVLRADRITAVGVNFFMDAMAAQPLYKVKRDDFKIWLDEIVKFCERGETSCYAENAFNEVSDLCCIMALDEEDAVCGEIDTEEDLVAVRKRITNVQVTDFLNIIGADFYTGVPDSQLKALCDYLVNTYGTDPKHHIIAANEGNAMAIAAGYHMATGKVPVVYMQNSGEGNVINPLASLMNTAVYGIPCVMIIGWRGEPGVHDEPQHVFQGQVTCKLLETMDIPYMVVDKETTKENIVDIYDAFKEKLSEGKVVAFVIKKGSLIYNEKAHYSNDHELKRETAISRIADTAGRDVIVSTTGKASRELFEIRERNGQGHEKDFLTVGSMGHASSIALGIAINKPDRRVWCIDGDGAALMHMGAMAVIGNVKPSNLVHVVINNGAHDTVGGQPTVAGSTDLTGVAKACGYETVLLANNEKELEEALKEVAGVSKGLTFLEVKCALGARDDLGRPTTTAIENKKQFMNYLRDAGRENM
ncbi:phosphonopyruvate decarboxylase [Butyrivibrio proteoclasticus]|uniref:phosphonopyruvate decarboxylase n=1 Tax=Butyrivibrio proteoclasticus TaxID=43305 RepID=UPI0009DDF1C6|nr:phosphonopyruvate decarboxylase [Butyrivibrio proteoclasticus]